MAAISRTDVDVSSAQTLAAKTLTTPVINGATTGTGVATANTGSTLVQRDASGNFSAGTITAALTGNASTATTATTAGNVSGTVAVGNGGTGATTLTGLVKGNGTSAMTAAVAGTDFVAPGGALGTPSSATLTNATGLPVSGITASTSAALGVGSLEIGHASDTSLTRSAAGKLAVEGVDLVDVSSNQTLTTKTITSPRVNQINDTGGAAAIIVSPTASAVNQLTVKGSASGGVAAIIEATGTDSLIFLTLKSKGSAAVVLAPNNINSLVAYSANAAVNHFTVNATTTGNAPNITATGSDTNISVNVVPKGTGTLQQGGVPVSTNSITATHTAQQIELGHATDTTLTRTAAGVPAVEGNPLGVRVGVPASAAAAGAVGQFSTDSSWLYVCTATDTWMRTAIATW